MSKLAPLILPPIIFPRDGNNGSNGSNHNYDNDRKEQVDVDEKLYDYYQAYEQKFNTTTNAAELNVFVLSMATCLGELVGQVRTVKNVKQFCSKAWSGVKSVCKSIEEYVRK